MSFGLCGRGVPAAIGHRAFHQACIDRWLIESQAYHKRECPMCKANPIRDDPSTTVASTSGSSEAASKTTATPPLLSLCAVYDFLVYLLCICAGRPATCILRRPAHVVLSLQKRQRLMGLNGTE